MLFLKGLTLFLPVLIIIGCDLFGSGPGGLTGGGVRTTNGEVAGGGVRTTNGEVAGRIKFADASPAEGIQIRLYKVFLSSAPESHSAEWAGISDSLGIYHFQNVPSGTFAMSVIDPIAGTRAILPRLTKAIEGYFLTDLILTPWVNLRGRVFASDSSKPENIRICLPGLNECVSANADSTYSFPKAPQGDYDLVFLSGGNAHYLPIRATMANNDTLYVKDIQLDSVTTPAKVFSFYATNLKNSIFVLPKTYSTTNRPTWYAGKSFDRIKYFIATANNQFEQWDYEDYFDWKYSKLLNAPPYSLTDNTKPLLVDFPYFLRLAVSEINFSQVQGQGEDLRVSRGDGKHLSYSIERWDSSSGTADIWVNLDTLYAGRATQRLALHWGNSEAQDRSDPIAALGRNPEARQLWTFDDNTQSSLVKDKRGTHPGYLIRTATGKDLTSSHSSIGVLGRSLKLDGIQDLITIDPHPILDMPTMTISIWAKNLKSNLQTQQYLVLKGEDGHKQWHLALDASNHLRFGLGKPDGTWSGAWTSKNPVARIDAWHHYAVTFNGGTIHAYVDGVELVAGTANGVIPKSIPALNSSIVLGKSILVTEQFWAGEVDNLGLENQARSAEWIKLIYDSQKPLP